MHGWMSQIIQTIHPSVHAWMDGWGGPFAPPYQGPSFNRTKLTPRAMAAKLSFTLRRERGEATWGARISTTDATQGGANTLSAVSSDSAAARSGLLVGDKICAVNGDICQHDGDAARYLKRCSGTAELLVSRVSPSRESSVAADVPTIAGKRKASPERKEPSEDAPKKEKHAKDLVAAVSIPGHVVDALTEAASHSLGLRVASFWLDREGGQIEAAIDVPTNTYEPIYSIGSTLLIIASGEGNARLVELLLMRGAMIDKQDTEGTSALMAAACRGKTEIVRLLLQKGARADLKDANGHSAVQIAQHWDEVECKHLIKKALREQAF